MTNTIKIKVPVTTVTTAIMYNDNTSEIKTFDLSGKYSNESAKKYFKENPVDNAKNVAILDTVKNVVNYEIELEKLLPVLAENGKVIVEE
jgi:hypothetical protein